MKTLKLKAIIIALIFAGGFSAQVMAQELSGRDIIEKVYNRPTGDDQTSDLTMTLINKSGSERVRKIKQFTKDFGDVEKSIMFFVSPADVKNTSFMNWTYDDDSKSDDQWIYLPAIKKTKRISSDSKSDSFMGSDFTYDDLGDRKLDADTHNRLADETIDGVEYYVVESISKDEEYMYSKTKTWVRKDHFIGLKKEFYDEDGELFKVLEVKKFEEIDGIIVITNSQMVDTNRDHRTSMVLSNVKINTGIPSSKFSERMMTRGI